MALTSPPTFMDACSLGDELRTGEPPTRREQTVGVQGDEPLLSAMRRAERRRLAEVLRLAQGVSR